MMTLILTLTVTIVIELGVLLFLGERRRRVLTASVVVNVLTNAWLARSRQYTVLALATP